MKGHQLYKQVDGCNATIAISSGGDLTATVLSEGWEYHPQSNYANGQTYQAFVNRQYIDLSGWSARALTMFTVGVDIQKDRMPLYVSNAGASPIIYVYDLLTTRKISDSELAVVSTCAPGFLPTTLSLQQVVYGEKQTLAINGAIGGTYINIDSGTFGSGTPNAQDKLHWTRIILTTIAGNEGAGSLGISPCNLVVQATTDQEKDLVYMERLRRSYVTQGRNT